MGSKSLFVYINEHRASIRRIFSFVLLIILQRIFRSFIFTCPCPEMRNATKILTSAVTHEILYDLTEDENSTDDMSPDNMTFSYRNESSQSPFSFQNLSDYDIPFYNSLLLGAKYRSTLQYRRSYALIFLIAPALCIYIIAFWVEGNTWKVLTGCCITPTECVSVAREKRIKLLSRPMVDHNPLPNACGCRAKLKDILKVCIRPLIPAIVWIVISLMDGRFLVCGYSDSPCNPSSFHSRGVRSKSQTLGWILLITLTLLILMAYLIGAVRSKKNYYEKRFFQIYFSDEENEIERFASMKSKMMATQRAEWFFDRGEDHNSKWWENDSQHPLIQHIKSKSHM